MATGRMHHNWDLFAPLICYVANPWLEERHRLTPEKVHPFLEKKEVKSSRSDWMELKALIKRERQ